MTTQLIRCPCGKRFPINTGKHPGRKKVYCPFCRTEHENKWYDSKWKPNAEWHKGKHKTKPFTVMDMRRALQAVTGAVRALGRVQVVKTPEQMEKGAKVEEEEK